MALSQWGASGELLLVEAVLNDATVAVRAAAAAGLGALGARAFRTLVLRYKGHMLSRPPDLSFLRGNRLYD